MINDTMKYPIIFTFLVGFFIVFIGSFFQASNPINSVFLGSGASIIASAIVFAIFLNKEALAHKVTKYGIREIYHNRHKQGQKFWVRFLSAAKTEIRILGVANHGYVEHGKLRDQEKLILKNALDKGIKVSILWLDPTSAFSQARDDEERRVTRNDAIESIKVFNEFVGSLEESNKSRIELLVYRKTPSCGITWVDNSMVVTHYLSGISNQNSPGFILCSSRIDEFLSNKVDEEFSALYDLYKSNYESIRSSAKTVTEDYLRKLIELKKNFLPGQAKKTLEKIERLSFNE